MKISRKNPEKSDFFAILGNECHQRDLLRTQDYLLPAYTRMQEIDFMD